MTEKYEENKDRRVLEAGSYLFWAMWTVSIGFSDQLPALWSAFGSIY